MFLKLRGTRVLWFVHNLQPHDLHPEHHRAWGVYVSALLQLIDGWITLSPSTAGVVVERYPELSRKPQAFIWHPPYLISYSGNCEQARQELSLTSSALIYGHVGQLRPYKKLVPLAERFEQIAPPGSQLLIAGLAKDGVDSALAKLSNTRDALDFRPGSLTSEEFERVLTALDVFIAPYGNFLHSGALIHALSCGCVVVAPRVPFTCDLVEAVGSDWVITYDGEISTLTLAKAAISARSLTGERPDLSALEPSANLERLANLLVNMKTRLPKVGGSHWCEEKIPPQGQVLSKS
nr:glycosyltransferase [Thermostichus vulcanus]